jgi:hypothetical protein
MAAVASGECSSICGGAKSAKWGSRSPGGIPSAEGRFRPGRNRKARCGLDQAGHRSRLFIIGDRCRYVVEHVIDHDGCGG